MPTESWTTPNLETKIGALENEKPRRRFVHHVATDLSTMSRLMGAFMKPPGQLYQVRGYTPVTRSFASGYTTEVNYMT
ncbi:hypothetical protein SAMN05444817_1022 [Corynebacterium appendicis CIP 107643]|uniref:Uncharacterized protein n=1 Tax=Corynebacterium appendicis CIP 107643 TaxID=1161099 RepID=A0A1N7IT26_9CORY|nr:hypothetical protein CAPP_04800 [Corynebacterium appendicis CIP 107643]SIS40242.1 hypothetical protein SAMN05444817_1022 [Corynebacterium appendicis CIP 107643]